MAFGLFQSRAFQAVLLAAVLLVLSSIQFMASVKSDLITSAQTVASILTLIVLVDAFRGLSGRK